MSLTTSEDRLKSDGFMSISKSSNVWGAVFQPTICSTLEDQIARTSWRDEAKVMGSVTCDPRGFIPTEMHSNATFD